MAYCALLYILFLQIFNRPINSESEMTSHGKAFASNNCFHQNCFILHFISCKLVEDVGVTLDKHVCGVVVNQLTTKNFVFTL